MPGPESNGVPPRGRLRRIARLGRLATGMVAGMAGAAGRMVAGGSAAAAAARFHEMVARRLVDVLGGMKGLPMKVGQMMSYIDDLIPAEHRVIYRDVLKQLQVKVRPMSYAMVARVLEEDLGAPPERLFARFDREPVAAASIGQVHRAALEDGSEVAVKIQYPGIADAIRDDLKNIELLKKAFGLVLPALEVEQTLADITDRVLEECDYGCELCNQDEFEAMWRGEAGFLVPRSYLARSSDHVLTTQYVEGRDWHALMAEAGTATRQDAAERIFRFVFRSLNVFGMFNGDPHPGNYLFLPDGTVAFIDFGCVQRYDPETVEGFARVRRVLMEGGRGTELREAFRETYQVPADLDEEEWNFMDAYVRCCYEPVIHDRPFRYDCGYTRRLAELSLKGSILGARKAVTKGVREARRPGIVFLNRIQCGLASILAAMEAQANWHRIIRAFDDELEARRVRPL